MSSYQSWKKAIIIGTRRKLTSRPSLTRSLGSMAGIERRVAHPLSSNRRHHYHHRGHQLCQIPLPAAGGQKAARAVEGVDQRGHHLGPWHRNNPPLSPLPLLRLYERLQQYKISPSRSRSKRRHCATKSKVLQPRQPKPPRWDMQPTGLTFGPPELLLLPPPPPPPPPPRHCRDPCHLPFRRSLMAALPWTSKCPLRAAFRITRHHLLLLLPPPLHDDHHPLQELIITRLSPASSCGKGNRSPVATASE